MTAVDVVVIGAGQAGLSTAYHLGRLGVEHVVLDGEAGPGGAWRHRWPSLTMATVNNIHDLPGMPKPAFDPAEPSRELLPRYFGEFESTLHLEVRRPVHVRTVEREDDDPLGRLAVRTDVGDWRARAVVNATGTWTKPFLPHYPGQESFLGLQVHTAQYRSSEVFRGMRVAVVGGGISAIQLMDEISRVGTTSWFTRREPVWHDGAFTQELGRESVAEVARRVEAGEAPGSVVSATGLVWNALTLDMRARGLLERRPMFTAVEPHGVRTADGEFEAIDAILWATGFRPAIDHLRPLHLRGQGGGIVMRGTHPEDEPRLHLVGYGPSASTVGANRAGAAAAREIRRLLVEG